MLTRKETANCCAMLRRIVYHDDSPLAVTDWERMRRLMVIHNIAGMVDCADDPALLPVQNKRNAIHTVIYRCALRETVLRLFQEMDKRGIVCAVLKGEALSACYSPDVVRVSGDIDLYLPGKQRDTFGQMMKELGFRLGQDINQGQSGEDDYLSKDGIHVEAHSIYFQRLSARRRKILKERGFFSDAFFERADGFVTLKPEAHLFYLVYHADKHIISHGVTLRMLMDLTQYVNRYADKIDKKAFRSLIRDLGLTRATNAILCFCIKHLGMRKDFWRKTGPSLEFLLRLMMSPTEDEKKKKNWESLFLKLERWYYVETCEETDQGYQLRHCYLTPDMKKISRKNFLIWWMVRLFWGFEVDRSGEAV